MSHVTAHILDATTGQPAQGISVTLRRSAGAAVATTTSNDDGRVPDLGPELLDAGDYQIEFGTGHYFAARSQRTFYPRVTIEFSVVSGQAHYHVPLLLSPFAYSTYRGS